VRGRGGDARLRGSVSDQVPLIKGKRVDCSGPCVVMAGGGETLDRIFFLNVDGYDAAPSSPPVHHMIIEARKVDRAPPSPCAGGAPAGTVVVKGREVTLLDCPPRTPEVDRQIMHGEGAHVEHVLGYWDENGIRYVVSVHGATDSNKSLLAQVIASIEIVERSPRALTQSRCVRAERWSQPNPSCASSQRSTDVPTIVGKSSGEKSADVLSRFQTPLS
jgi:hypothetical protein